MRHFAKIAARLVIAAIALAPMQPATPCGSPTQSMACFGHRCPMISKASVNHGRGGPDTPIVQRRCCSRSSHPVAPGVLKSGLENTLGPATEHQDSAEAVLPFSLGTMKNIACLGRGPRHRGMQAIHCTFLI